MHITGERHIPAPCARVWRSLTDSTLLPDSIAGTRPILARQSVREPFATLGWKIDPDGPESQLALVRLAEDGAATRLSYEVSLADPESETDSGAAETALRGRIEAALERFAKQIAGPAEHAAGGIADAMRAASQPAPRAGVPAGGETAFTRVINPSVIGGVLFLGVLMLVLGLT